MVGVEIAERLQRLGKRLAAGLALVGRHHQHHEGVRGDTETLPDGLFVAGVEDDRINPVWNVVESSPASCIMRTPNLLYTVVFCRAYRIYHGWRRGTAVYGKTGAATGRAAKWQTPRAGATHLAE